MYQCKSCFIIAAATNNNTTAANLVVYNELGVLVEDWILSFRQRSEVFQHVLWMDVGRSRVHDVISLLHQLPNTHCIPMTEVILTAHKLPDKTGVQIKFSLRPKLRPNLYS